MKKILNYALIREDYLSSEYIWHDISARKNISGEEIVLLYELWQNRLAKLQYEAWMSPAETRLEKCMQLRALSQDFPEKFKKLLAEHEVAVTNYGSGLLLRLQKHQDFFLRDLVALYQMWVQFPPVAPAAHDIILALGEVVAQYK